MRKIIVGVHMTLDGSMSGPEGGEDNIVGWGLPGITDSTPDFQRYFESIDRILFGRVTYEGLAQFWPTATGEFADYMNNIPKIVFSRGGLKEVAWGEFKNISLIKENVEEEVKKLKAQTGKDMIIFASSKLVQSFTNAGLIDDTGS
jgi:dihydrofolate reductase